MELDRVFAEAEAFGEFAVAGYAFDHQLEHFALARGQRLLGGRRGGGFGWFGELLEELSGERRRERWLAAGGAVEELEERIRFEVLEQVALRAGFDGVEEFRFLFRRGEDHDFHLRRFTDDQLRRADAVELRHLQVHQHEIGLELARERHRFAAVLRFADDLVSLRKQEASQAVAEERVIVGNEDTHASEVYVRDNKGVSQQSPVPPLLATKLHVPQPRPGRVARERLRERIRATGGGVTLLSAPAGSGKSTLLAEWVAGADCAVAWLSLEASDADVPRLLAYVVAALRNAGAIAPDAIPEGLLGSAGSREIALTAITNAIAERGDAAALVLDDFHTIDGDDAHAAVQFLLDHLPPNLHVVIASRVDPPLALSRLRARGQLAEIRAADLRFTSEETRAFLQDAMSLTLPDAQIEELEKKTEGWAAGLQLAALSLRGSGSVAALRGTNRYILDYLTEEVLSSQPEELRDFLLETSVLDRLCGPLCDRVLQRIGSDETLQELDAANLFLTPLDDVRVWYRYHHLFADVLQHRLRKRSGEAHLAELHRRASDWYRDSGLPEEALQHALLAEDFDRATAIVSQHAFGLMLNGQSALVVRWLGLLPQERVHASVELLLTHAVALAAEYRFAESQQALERVREFLGDDETSPHFAAYLVTRGLLETMTGTGAEETLTRALALLPRPGFWRSLASFNLGMGGLMRHDLQRAETMFDVVRRETGDGRRPLTAVLAQSFSGWCHLLRGEFDAAEELAHEGIAWTEPDHGPPSPLAALPYALLSDFYVARHELERAHDAAQRSLVYGRQTLLGAFEASRMVATVAEAMHDWDAATRTIAEAGRTIRYSANMNWRHYLDILLHRTILRRGIVIANANDIATVGEWVDARNLRDFAQAWQKRTLPGFFSDMQFLTVARLFIEQSRFDDALGLLDLIGDHAIESGNVATSVEVRVLRAIAQQRRGRNADAIAAMQSALTLAAKPQYVRPFAIEGASLLPLLEKSAQGSVFANAVMSTMSTVPKRVAAAPDGLSEREIEVLQLIAAGASNSVAAGKLFVAPSTVKKHLENIYAKLGVSGRVQAIARARELQLL